MLSLGQLCRSACEHDNGTRCTGLGSVIIRGDLCFYNRWFAKRQATEPLINPGSVVKSGYVMGIAYHPEQEAPPPKREA